MNDDSAMNRHVQPALTNLIGIGLYTPAEAGTLLRIAPSTINRWLRGHTVSGKDYEPLWSPQIDLGDDGICLGFRDLQEVRVASAFIKAGLTAYRVRQAISLARDFIEEERPLSTTRFRTDGRSVFLDVVEADGQSRLIDLFKRQFAFREIIEQSLTDLEYDEAGIPARWWPLGKPKGIVVDPSRSFGQPIDAETSVPVDALVSAVAAEGSDQAAARAWDVPLKAVRRALTFRDALAASHA